MENTVKNGTNLHSVSLKTNKQKKKSYMRQVWNYEVTRNFIILEITEVLEY